MPNHIVLIGPPDRRLSAVGKLLAEQLGLPLHFPDEFTDEEWGTLGYDYTTEMLAWARGGAFANYRLHMPMRVRAVEKLMAIPGCSVITLPPDFVVHEEAEHFERLAACLAQTPHVILLIPTPDASENALLLDADLADFPDLSTLNAHFVRHPSNERLAKQVVYTEGKSLEETRDEILRRRSDSTSPEIILIGPKLAGKSTLGRLLADALNVPQVSLDMVGRSYLAETDYDWEQARKARAEKGLFGWSNYMRPYELHMAERVLAATKNAVIDFGAGHSYYDDETHFARMQQALAPFANVFLILPSPDKETSVAVLKKRFEADVASERKLQRLLVTYPVYGKLANHTVYTKGKSPEEIIELVVGELSS